MLFVSFVAPHFPLTAPAEHFYRYYEDDALPWPKLYAPGERPAHPYVTDYAGSFCYDRYFGNEDLVRRGVAGYYGLCTFLDEQIGKVLAALDATGLADSTTVLYTSDHGDNLGSRGLWGKSTMYEEAAAVPLVVAGEGIPAGRTIDTHVSHVDVYPFILECAGALDERSFIDARAGASIGGHTGALTGGHPGVSLAALAHGATPERTILSEYHGMGSTTAAYMVRLEHYKFVHYVGYPDQLFDLASDPEELHDVAGEPANAGVVAEALGRLRTMLDPVGGGRPREGAPSGAAGCERRARGGHRPRRPGVLGPARGRADVRLKAGAPCADGARRSIARGDLGFSVPPGVAPMFD